MKKYLPIALFIVVAVVFSWKFFIQGLLPIPADTLVGLYHPYRDFYSNEYPNGIPFKNFLITDPIRQQYPWRWLALDGIKQGVTPQWNPYSFSGTPLGANYQSAVYYPLNLLLLVTPFHIGWSILTILQPALSGIFMFLYLRKMYCSTYASIIGGLVYAFCGFNIAWFTWNTIGHVVLWLPLVLYSKEKILDVVTHKKPSIKKQVLFGTLMVVGESFAVLAGHPQTGFYVFCISNIYLFARIYQVSQAFERNLRKAFLLRVGIFFTIAGFITTIITAIQIIPFVQFLLQSGRGSDQDFTQPGWFIPFKHLVQFLAPDFFGNPATLNYWGVWNYGELVGYVGVMPLLFVFVSLFNLRRKMVLFFVVVATCALLFSTENAIARVPFIFNIPLLSTSQPTRLLFVVDFCFAVLSAIGFDLLRTKKLAWKKIAMLCFGVILLYGLLWISTFLRIFTENEVDIATSKRNLIFPMLLLALSTFYVLFSRKIPMKFQWAISSVVIVIIVVDLFRFGWKFTPFVSAEYLYPTTKSIEFIQNQPGLFRTMSLDNRLLPPNVAVIHKIQSIDGYDPLYLANYGELASSIVRNTPDISPFSFNRIITIQQVDNRLIDLMNVRYVFSMTDIDNPKLIKVFEEGQTKLYENQNVFSRAFLVSNIKKASSKQEAINYLYDENVDLHTTAVVYDDIVVSPFESTEGEIAEITSYENSRIEMRVTTAQTRLLVLSDVYYPNWHSYIDGVETKLYEVNYAFRGVVVPAGDHIVEFKYL